MLGLASAIPEFDAGDHQIELVGIEQALLGIGGLAVITLTVDEEHEPRLAVDAAGGFRDIAIDAGIAVLAGAIVLRFKGAALNAGGGVHINRGGLGGGRPGAARSDDDDSSLHPDG